MTFFPWPGAPRGRIGAGPLTVSSFAVPEKSLPYWREHLRKRSVEFRETTSTFGQETLFLKDPDGLQLELVSTSNADPDRAWEHFPGSRLNCSWGLTFQRRKRQSPVQDNFYGTKSTQVEGVDAFVKLRLWDADAALAPRP